MPDLKNTIDGLERCIRNGRCGGCPYADKPDCIKRRAHDIRAEDVVPHSMAVDALELLRGRQRYRARDSDLYLDYYARVGDVLDCFDGMDLSNPEVFHAVGLIEWALGKRSEPRRYLARIMPIEEVAGMVALKRNAVIYMEFEPFTAQEGEVIGLNTKYMCFDVENSLSWDVCEGPRQGEKDSVALDEYGIVWRCWTSRPTDEQRKAVKWE